MTANDLAALRAAVLSDPSDPAPRLILADALDESGDEARAGWMRRVAEQTSGDTQRGCCWEHIRAWEQGAFRLDLYWTLWRTYEGKETLAYELWHQGAGPIFWGEDYGCAPSHAVDSDESVAGLLAFLSLRPGDTDREYFATYTSEQLAWAQENGEELSAIAADLEEGNWHNPKIAALADSEGELPAYAWPGGYPLYYLTADNGTLCPNCANMPEPRHATPDEKQWHVVAQGCHWEGAPIECDHCGAEIESAYGDPDAPETEE